MALDVRDFVAEDAEIPVPNLELAQEGDTHTHDYRHAWLQYWSRDHPRHFSGLSGRLGVMEERFQPRLYVYVTPWLRKPEQTSAEPGHVDVLARTRDTLPEKSRLIWDELCTIDQTDLRGVLIHALDTYWAKRLSERTREAYEALASDPETLAAYEQECADWEATLLDGLGDE